MSDPIIPPLNAPEPTSVTAHNESIAKGARILRMLESKDHDAGQLMRPARSTAQSDFTNALAQLAPPPPDARSESKWAPWLALTWYEIDVLRKQFKKSANWTPSFNLVGRELGE